MKSKGGGKSADIYDSKLCFDDRKKTAINNIGASAH